jgi:hypothetical protein
LFIVTGSLSIKSIDDTRVVLTKHGGYDVPFCRKLEEGEGSSQVFDKTLLKKIEDIENLSDEGKKQVYDLIDMALGYHKTKQNFTK